MPRLKDRLLEQLVSKGILERRERRILWDFPLAELPAGGRRRRAAGAIGFGRRSWTARSRDQRTAALIGLVRACNLTDEIFAPHERPQANRRVAELTSEEAATSGLLGAAWRRR